MDAIFKRSTCVFNKLSGLSISDRINSGELTRFGFGGGHHTSKAGLHRGAGASALKESKVNFTGRQNKKMPELAPKNGTNLFLDALSATEDASQSCPAVLSIRLRDYESIPVCD